MFEVIVALKIFWGLNTPCSRNLNLNRTHLNLARQGHQPRLQCGSGRKTFTTCRHAAPLAGTPPSRITGGPTWPHQVIIRVASKEEKMATEQWAHADGSRAAGTASPPTRHFFSTQKFGSFDRSATDRYIRSRPPPDSARCPAAAEMVCVALALDRRRRN